MIPECTFVQRVTDVHDNSEPYFLKSILMSFCPKRIVTWFVSIHVWGCHPSLPASGIPVNNGPASRIPLNFELESRILIDKKRRKTPLELPMHTFNNANIHLVWLCDSPVNMIYIYYKYLAKSIRYVNRWQNVCALPKSLIDKPKMALLRKFRN